MIEGGGGDISKSFSLRISNIPVLIIVFFFSTDLTKQILLRRITEFSQISDSLQSRI
jgi:hypothetical protein